MVHVCIIIYFILCSSLTLVSLVFNRCLTNLVSLHCFYNSFFVTHPNPNLILLFSIPFSSYLFLPYPFLPVSIILLMNPSSILLLYFASYFWKWQVSLAFFLLRQNHQYNFLSSSFRSFNFYRICQTCSVLMELRFYYLFPLLF